MLSGALMILYCFRKVKVLIVTIPGIILSVMVRRGILGAFYELQPALPFD
jgi:hypothetical protein